MRSSGFTLIELIVVIVILSVLGAVAVPIYVSVTTEAKSGALSSRLGAIRSAISMQYTNSIFQSGTPSYPAQLTGSLFKDGKVPTNPINGLNTVRAWNGNAATNDQTGWDYHAASGTVRANSRGSDTNGKLWGNY